MEPRLPAVLQARSCKPPVPTVATEMMPRHPLRYAARAISHPQAAHDAGLAIYPGAGRVNSDRASCGGSPVLVEVEDVVEAGRLVSGEISTCPVVEGIQNKRR